MINLQNITALQQQFKNSPSITQKDLYDFFALSAKKKSEADFLWYIYELKDKNIIKTIGLDVYQLHQPKTNFDPLINDTLQAVSTILSKDFPLLNTCIWTTEWLNEFTIHQTVHPYTFIEVEDSACESVFYHLRDSGLKNIFLKPDTLLMNRYVSESDNPIIILKLLSRSPLMSLKIGNEAAVTVPKLEKILVDLYCDDILFPAYKGHEQDQIFQRILKNYAIDLTTFFAYAERRKRKTLLMNYLHQHFKDIITEFKA